MIHFFDTDVAKQYGVNAAVLLYHISYWIKHNEANGTNYYDGNFWTYNSTRAFAELFPYMSERQISTALSKLIDDGVIITGNYNKSAYDRTMWYALTQKGKCILQKCNMDTAEMSNGLCKNVKWIPQKCEMDTAEMSNGLCGNVGPIPDNIPNNKPDNIPNNNYAANPKRHRHGEYNHVLLSDSEYQKLKDEYGEDITEKYIRKVDEYCEQSGKTYKNYYLAIRNTFMKRDGIKATKKEEEHHDWLKREDLPNGNWILYYDDREEEYDFCGNLLARRFKKR